MDAFVKGMAERRRLCVLAYWLSCGGLRFAIRERGFGRETADLAQVVCLK